MMVIFGGLWLIVSRLLLFADAVHQALDPVNDDRDGAEGYEVGVHALFPTLRVVA
jgi:hypothetical protein